MKKHIPYIALIIIIILLGISIFRDQQNKKTEGSLLSETGAIQNETPETYSDTSTKSDIKPSVQNSTVINKNLPMPEKAWQTFETYMTAAKNHDLQTIKRLAYKLSPICTGALTDKTKEAECFSRLDQAYSAGSTLKKESFKNSFFDSKQVILFTDIKFTETPDTKIAAKSFIYFVTDSENNLKLLSLELGREFTVKKSEQAPGTVDSVLSERTKDSDSDGIEDVVESCGIKISDAECVDTNPNKKDSDGDGYFDSIDKLL